MSASLCPVIYQQNMMLLGLRAELLAFYNWLHSERSVLFPQNRVDARVVLSLEYMVAGHVLVPLCLFLLAVCWLLDEISLAWRVRL